MIKFCLIRNDLHNNQISYLTLSNFLQNSSEQRHERHKRLTVKSIQENDASFLLREDLLLRLEHWNTEKVKNYTSWTLHWTQTNDKLVKEIHYNKKNELITWEKNVSINTHITLWILKSCLKVLSLKSTYSDHQIAHWWHEPASPQCMIRHLSRFELRMAKISPKTIVFKVKKNPSWRYW